MGWVKVLVVGGGREGSRGISPSLNSVGSCCCVVRYIVRQMCDVNSDYTIDEEEQEVEEVNEQGQWIPIVGH